MQTKERKSAAVESEAVWADESAARPPATPATQLGNYFRTSILLTLLVSAVSAAALVAGDQPFRQLVSALPGRSGEALMTNARLWALNAGLAGIAGAAALCLYSFVFTRRLERDLSAQVKSARAELNTRSQRLMGQMADAKFSAEENRREVFEVRSQLEDLTRRNAALEKELEERRAAEKSLAKHTVLLERSKDVLEMHVQARTQQMQKLQRRYELILNSAGDGICGFDLQGKATFVNPAVARLTGWKAEELLGKTEEEIFFPLKAAGSKDSPWIRDSDGKLFPEQLLCRKDGSTFSSEYLKTPIHENELPVGSVVIFRDITERRTAENKLKHKAAELARSNKELEQFAFVASHDLQEPLRKIQAFGDRLKTKCASVLVAEGRDYLERMQSAAARMQTLINDLLTFSRVISSSQPFVEVDLGVITREVLVDLEHRIEKTGATVEVGELPRMEADPTQMRQLLQNLIGNALKFKKKDAAPLVSVTAKVIQRQEIDDWLPLPKPSAHCRPEDKICRLEVRDNGIGFDEQYLEKVFAVFQRLHGREEYEGTGVGLAVCRRISERHGGTITARSKPGEGATFVVLMPLRQPEQASAT